MIDLSDRKSVQELMLVNSAQALSREQYAKFKDGLEAMPDEVFWQVVAECIATAPKDCGYKEQAKLLDEVRNANGITPKNSAMHDLQIGHWRTIKSGAKIFIKPCWKGPLRDVKVTLTERERIIVQAAGGAQ